MMQERFPLRNGETTSIEFLFGLTSEMERAKRDLRNRLEKTGQTRLFREIDTKLQNVLTKLLSTVPEHKIRTLRANLDYQEIKIVTKGYAADDGFTRVRAGALQDLCAFASKEKCAMCFGEGQDMAGCQFRKILKELIMVDVDESGRCMGRMLDFENATIDEEAV